MRSATGGRERAGRFLERFGGGFLGVRRLAMAMRETFSTAVLPALPLVAALSLSGG